MTEANQKNSKITNVEGSTDDNQECKIADKKEV